MTTALTSFNDQASSAADVDIPARFRRIAAEHAEAIAFASTTQRVTYGELNEQSDRIAAALIAMQTPPDLPIAIASSDARLLIAGMLGVLKASRFFVMLDGTMPASRGEAILADSMTPLCLTDGSMDQVPLPAGTRRLRFEEVLNGGFSTQLVMPRADGIMYLAYTSGSTGKPKALVRPAAPTLSSAVRAAARLQLGPGVKVAFFTTGAFARTIGDIFQTILNGAQLCYFDPRSASLGDLADWVVREEIAIMKATPSMFRRLFAAAPETLRRARLRIVRASAEATTTADIAEWKRAIPENCEIHVAYGTTEAGGVFQMRVPDDFERFGAVLPMGSVHGNVDVALIGDDGQQVPDGEVGEIVVTGRLALGYWRNGTIERFEGVDGRTDLLRFRTGDLARRDADGLYYFLGRKDARLKIRGHRIEPGEVEAAMLALKDIREAAAVGHPDPEGNLQLVVYYAGASLLPGEIRRELARRLPDWMLPSHYVAVEQLPMTPGEKIDRVALAVRPLRAPEVTEDSGDDLESRLRSVWSRVLGTPVRNDDDFFEDLGGESLIGAHLVTVIQRDLGYRVPLPMLVELNTVARMAGYLRRAGDRDKLIIPINPGGKLPAVFCTSGEGGSVLKYRVLSSHLGADQPFYGIQHLAFVDRDFPLSVTALATAFAEAIREVQPQGPYYLAGYSAGGNVTLEIARYLMAAGERVAFIGLIDTTAMVEKVGRFRRTLFRFERLIRQPAELPTAAKRFAGSRWRWFATRLRPALLGLGVGVPDWMRASKKAYRRTREEFGHAPFAGDLTLFLARRGMTRIRRSADLGWGEIVTGRITVVEVDGDHETVLTRDVAGLAAAFARELARARETVSAES